MVISRQYKLGKVTLDTVEQTLHLQNRTNNYKLKIPPEAVERYQRYMDFGNQRQGGGGQNSFVRLTGMFPTKKGGLRGNVEVASFNTIFKMMQEANAISGTLTFVVSKNARNNNFELYAIVNPPYQKQQQAPAAPAGPFAVSPAASAQLTPAPTATGFAPATPAPREIQFGSVDVPADDFDQLLEKLT